MITKQIVCEERGTYIKSKINQLEKREVVDDGWGVTGKGY